MGALNPVGDPVDVTLVSSGADVEIVSGPRLLARYVVEPDVPTDESPRPFLHPIRTLGGVPVTDFQPEDHRWHHGLSLAVPFVGDANLWGGGSWDPALGAYADSGRNGSMRHLRLAIHADHRSLEHEVSWHDAAGGEIAREQRILRVGRASGSEGSRAWSLEWRSAVTNTSAVPLSLGSPATRGRPDAGYGGLFFRTSPGFSDGAFALDGAPVEESLLRRSRGTRASMTSADQTTRVTLDTATADTTWFGRSAEYPGFGPAPFSETETLLHPGASLDLACTVTVEDLLPLAEA